MKQEHIKDLLPDYLDTLLDPDQNRIVERHIEQCKKCSNELEQFRTIFKAFDQDQEELPTDELRHKFFEQLEQEKETNVIALNTKPTRTKNSAMHTFLKLAASIALLIASFWLGSYQEKQRSSVKIAAAESTNMDMKQVAMISLMENKSASKRIQGVNFTKEFENPDQAIVKALSERMLHDENTNVRLNAVEALAKFSKSATVTSSFIEALGIEKDPNIQIMIIQILVKIQEKKAVRPMRQLMEQEDVQPFVKQQIESLLPTII
ncbi:HEAT repeat domain-containing protein [Maribacter sp. X9]|uniref:HEAT repeat domain-containing protein n=1 Tax=Maribacter sp. X9 TaxID=3402159 RepID=UPI003AF40955